VISVGGFITWYSGTPGFEKPSAHRSLPYNDLARVGVQEDVGRRGAAIILEPVAANMGVVPPSPDFWRIARNL